MTVVHAQTQALIDLLISEPPQALLLTGRRGVGLFEVASQIVATQPSAVIRPSEEKTSCVISVEQIRRLYSDTKSKSRSRQFIVIVESERMTFAAQTAFLKLLEEPARTVHFILITDAPNGLLPTILSRVQRHDISPITKDQSMSLIASLGIADNVKQKQILYIAEGLPEEIQRLASDEVYFSAAVQRIKDARELLQASTYEKLLMADKYKGDRENAISLIDDAIMLSRRSLSQHPQPVIIRQLERLLRTKESLLGNQNIRLQLAHLVI